MSPELKSIDQYHSSLQQIFVDGEMSPRGLIVRMDNYLNKVSLVTESLSEDLHNRRENLRRSAENANIELTKIADYDPILSELRAKHSDVLKKLENHKSTQTAAKPDMTLWERPGGPKIEHQASVMQINVKLPDGRKYNKFVKVQGEAESKKFKSTIAAQAKGFVEQTVMRRGYWPHLNNSMS